MEFWHECEKWKQNIETALSFGIPHISSYALTVEPKTALNKLIQTGKIAAPKDEVAQEHFAVLVETLEANDLYTMNCQILAKKLFSRIIRRIGWEKIPWNWSFCPQL
jgi:coproporphyrinogen III oxidase-like Fe-S oxidoreductase